MRNLITTLFLLFFFSTALLAQYTIDSQGTNSVCTGTFHDSGGSGGSHGGNENYTQSFCSDAGDCLTMQFTSFDLGNGDNLIIYDGPNTSSTVLGTYNDGTGSPGTVNSSTGCLTFQFTSNAGNNGPGWDATISCQACPSPQTFTLNGDAQYITVGGEQCIQLTDAVNDQTGCAWNDAQIDFGGDFTLSLDYYFGNNTGGADGSTFTFQPSSSTACGQSGAQLGGGGMANTLVVEFDTYDNDGGSGNDMACDHIAVEIDSDLPDDPINFPANTPPLCGPVCAKSGGGNIDDGGTYPVDIVWSASTNTLEIYFDGVLRITCVNDFVTNAFGGANQVYWGATASTGGLNNQQYFCPSSIVILPVGLSDFTSECNGTSEVFNWTTETENNVEYFELEYTYDGLIFYPETTVDAAGNSMNENFYSTRVETNDDRERYYRLKIVDTDGSIQTSEVIASKNCNSQSLIKSIGETEDEIMMTVNGPVRLQLVNMMGQVVADIDKAIDGVKLNKQSLSTGMYQLIVTGKDGAMESKKIVVQ